MNKKIIFQKCTFDYIYFLLYTIASSIMNILYHFSVTEDNPKENLDKNDYNHFELSKQLLITYSSNIADFLAIIPYFIRKKQLKKSNVSSKKIESPEIDDKVKECKGQNELTIMIFKYLKLKKEKNY